MLDCLRCIFTSAGLHAAPVEKSLKKGGVQAIASCKDCGPTADMLTAVDEGVDQVINGKQYIPPRFRLIFIVCLPPQPIAERVMGGDEAEDPAAAEAGSDIDLLEDEDEAIGDRIMEVGAPASLN